MTQKKHIPQGHSFQYPLEGYKFRLNRLAVQLSSILPGLILAILLAGGQAAEAARLKDLATVKGVRDNQLVGYGLVVGLSGTGDGNKSPFTTQALVNMLENMGVHVNPADLKVKNVAGVLVTATLPPFVKIGQNIDINLSSLGDASSLAGGTLIATPLKALDGKIYAMAQGPVSIGGFELQGGDNRNTQKNHVTVARIPTGATVEKEVPFSLLNKTELSIHLNNPDFTTMNRVVKAVDALLAGSYAKAKDSATVAITVPPKFSDNQVALLAALENLDITPDTQAKIIIDERTGTVVMGENVTISAVAVAHGNLSIQVNQVPGQAPAQEENRNTTARDKENLLVQLDSGVTLGEVVRALNSVGVTTRDLIAIFQSMKASGAIKADLQII
ncbi:MAG: flagellar basal body P-ring protein FlgI [Proteobacteria bacterium]|nr:flagellar basal body P-ring protein FlgI [Pseudomonadota bacterium]MBU1639861.1 flagellar basal body P-ring protein FlgI [Pseudomonadota bacterium]